MQPFLVAHRGASADRPEHTLAAYELAVEQGADGVECDVRLTRDGHLVCVHDRTVSRTSDGRGSVGDLTLAELAEFDYGSWHSRPAPLLTLRALLELVADTGVRLFAETKHPARHGSRVEARLLAELAEFGLADGKATVLSFSGTALRRIAAQSAHVPTVLLTDQVTARRPLPRTATIAGPSISTLRADPDYVRRAGREIYAWTVDEPADIALCARLGVRYLATNVPGKARAALG
ncbi:glycerophosphodiester phosphodiesterase family protein [Sciscionella sediminilitoris]|uniref:glycerophosphodiester phosphodiesterase family protein n=1 Tax=Sciscionella sediminilitoris TaxID=1445613 RepID=UPI00068CC79E|nr:glycerophosphodiester phosphodiesterase family protein [Sciscionella sp. SE31]